MTRIDFYQLNPARHRYDQVVCQLCQKAYDSQQLTLLLTRDPQQSQHLDQKLWTFRDDSFLPHDSEEVEGLVSPILIHDNPDPGSDRQLLINLSPSVPIYFAQFERVIELEPTSSEARSLSPVWPNQRLVATMKARPA